MSEEKNGTFINFHNWEGRDSYMDSVAFETTDKKELMEKWWDFCCESGLIDSISSCKISLADDSGYLKEGKE